MRVAVALAAVSVHAIAQSPALPDLPTISGRVVRGSDGEPVSGALVEAYPDFRDRTETRTEASGAFTRIGAPSFVYTTATNTKPYDLVQYLRVSGAGVARTIVDPCADAPWAAPIRVRTSSTLRGRVDGLPPGPGHHVAVLVSWKDLCWPPRTGLTRVDERWIGDLDADGRFEIRDVPAEVPLAIRFDAGTSHGLGAWLTKDLALAPGEVRELALDASGSKAPADDEKKGADGPWIPVAPGENASSRASANLVAFDFVDGSRFQQHRVGGGRWHVHGSRACNDLEALPGARTLIGFDARGRIGLERLDILATDTRVVPLVTLAPGALLRIAFDGPEERARIALSSRGIEYAARELPRGVVWYELAPTGKVAIRVTSNAAEPRSIELDAHAGRIVRVEL